MKVEVNRNAKSRRPSNRRAWKYWHPNAQWLYLELSNYALLVLYRQQRQ